LFGATLNRIDTLRCWAPFQVVFVVHICPHKQLLISLCEVRCDKQIKALGIDDFVTTFARTLDSCGFTFVPNLLGQILSVAIHAEAMPTFHGEGLEAWLVLRTDLADEVGYCFDPRRVSDYVLSKTGLVQHLLRV
jgi:hypothetical protein